MSDKPRPYTRDEMRQMVVEQLIASVDYWSNPTLNHGPLRNHTPMTVRDRVSGAVFSALSMIDGCTDMPSMLLVPCPHPDDKEYHRQEGSDWWPDPLASVNDAVDLAGELHSMFAQMDRAHAERRVGA